MWQEIGDLLQDIFYPNYCPQCQSLVADGALLCPKCRALLARNFKETYLHAPSAGLAYWYAYEQGIKDALHQSKYAGARHFVRRLGRETALHLPFAQLQKIWNMPQKLLVVPIPTEPTRLKQRGYDLPAEIFREWCLAQGFSWAPILARRPGTLPQYGLNKREREQNVQHSFILEEKVPQQDVLLVDDIVTTGATLLAAAKVLRRGGKKRVWGLAFSGRRS